MKYKKYKITLSDNQYKTLTNMVLQESARLARVASEYDNAKENALDTWGKPFLDYVNHQSSILWDEALTMSSIHTKLLAASEIEDDK